MRYIRVSHPFGADAQKRLSPWMECMQKQCLEHCLSRRFCSYSEKATRAQTSLVRRYTVHPWK